MEFNEEVEQVMHSAEREFKTTIKLMEFFLHLGKITNENQSFKTKVEYKQRIVFSTMDSLMQGNFDIPSDWDDLSDYEKDERLNQTINSVLN